MLKITAALAASLLLAASPSYAAGLSTTINNTTQSTVDSAARMNNTSQSGGLTDTSTFADVIGTLHTNSATGTSAATDLTSINSGTTINVVLLSHLKGYTKNGLKLSKADAQSMAQLDAQVAANADLSAKLKKLGFSASEVAAVSVGANGSATVFVTR